MHKFLILLICCSFGSLALHCLASVQISTAPKAQSSTAVIQGYYPYWEYKKNPPDSLDIRYISHLSHAFVWSDSKGNLCLPPSFTIPALRDRLHAAGKKMLVCVGGSEASRDFPGMAADPVIRRKFVYHLARFVYSNQYDGAEIDWEFPRSSSDTKNLTSLIKELRAVLGPAKIINLVVHGDTYAGKWIDPLAVSPFINYFVVMTYDYHGAWSEFSGHNAPLVRAPASDGGVKDGLEYWLARGVPRERIIMGLAFYGRFFTCLNFGDSFQRSGSVHYRDIITYDLSEYSREWDYAAYVPFMRSLRRQWILSYDDPVSIRLKVQFARMNKFGGVMVWHLGSDIVDGRHLLLPSVYIAMHAPLPGLPRK